MSPQEETLSIPTPAPLACPACGTSNTPDSKFCRHCGQLLRAPEARAKVAAPAEPDEGDDALTSPQEIDARRARQLLDRALHLSERGDLSAAILACRQASTLDASNAAPFAMLGTLLERNGDVRGAVSAYERVMSLSPNSPLERESLMRLRARLDRAPAFNFNPDELYNDDQILPSLSMASEGALEEPMSASDAASVAQTEAVGDAIAGAGAGAPSDVEEAREQSLPAIEARLPPTSASLRASEAIGDEETADSVEGAPVSSFEEDAPSSLSAYAPTFAPEPPPDHETDPFWQTLAGGAIDGHSGAGKPAVSSLAQALDPETLAVVGQEAAAQTALPAGALPSTERRQGARRQVNLPVATERRTRDRRAPVTAPVFGFAPVPRASDRFAPQVAPTSGVRPLDFRFPAASAPRLPLWALLLRGPSFFGRTLPLIAVGALSLGFLSWARSQAVTHEVDRVASAPAVVMEPSDVVVDPAQSAAPASGVTAQTTTNTSNPGSPVLVTNAPPAAPVAGTAPVAAAPSARQAPRVGPVTPPRGGAAPRPVPIARPRVVAPVFPRVSVAPAPVPPPAAPPSSSGGNIILPPPRIDIPQPAAPPIQVGSALTPGGGPRRNTINITRSEIIRVPPPRTGSVARSQERDAAAATRTGQTDQAINNLTGAINATGSDAGYLYQQRAMLLMQRGDSARASDDFQASINAYQDQLNRGENVAAAQAGLRAARSGLAVAQASR